MLVTRGAENAYPRFRYKKDRRGEIKDWNFDGLVWDRDRKGVRLHDRERNFENF